MLVSYILPIYNVEAYLPQCVDSLLGQTYRDIEVILVDDGSPDACPHLCDEYAEKDSRIRVIHKENGGLSDARNVGLNAAKGEYIIFVDSDDFWADTEALQRLVGEAQKADWPDMVAFNIMYYYPSMGIYKKWPAYGPDITDTQDVNHIICALTCTGTMPMSACCKMLRRSILQHDRLRFIKGITAEDTPWFIDLLQVIRTVKYVNDYIYCYRCEVAGSITHTFKEKRFIQYLDTTEALIPNIQHSNVFSPEAKSALLSFVAYQFSIAASQLHLVSSGVRASLRQRIKSHMWLLKYTENPKVKLAAKAHKFFGFRGMELLLRTYMKYRARKQ